ncbi:MAG: Uma2 family endonuclease [Cytophagales bacterium]|nr:Uma2 family endonuclease [Cytophagales bacterium]
MGDALLKKTYYTLEEYEELARNAGEGERYEYCDGMIIPMAEYTTDSHNQIVQNAADTLKIYFYPKGCRVNTENVRLMIGTDEYRLPDVMATCSNRDLQSRSEKRDPVVVVEVLSPGTALQDLGSKLDSYRKIESLQAYLIIDPGKVWVRVYERTGNYDWLPDQLYTNRSDTFTLGNLNLQISLADLYRFVTIPDPDPKRRP